MTTNKDTLINELLSIRNEMMAEDIESNNSIINLLTTTVDILECGKEVLEESENPTAFEEYVDEIETTISELKCEEEMNETIRVLTEAYNCIKIEI